MRIEKLKDNRVNDFINYCKKHRSEVDDSFLYDADLKGFKVDENKTYIVINETSEEIVGAVSIIINFNYMEDKKSRLRIFHSEVDTIEVYHKMLESVLRDVSDVNRLFLFIKSEDERMDKILRDLDFNIERYSYTLIKDDLDNIEPLFPKEFQLKPFKFRRDEKDWCEVSNEAFKVIKGSTFKTHEMISRMENDEDLLEDGMMLLYHNEKPIGQVIVSKEVEDDINYAFISSLCVKPWYSGKGLGRNLLRAGLSQGRNAGMAKGMLTVNGENSKALELYINEGFRVDSGMVCYNFNIRRDFV